MIYRISSLRLTWMIPVIVALSALSQQSIAGETLDRVMRKGTLIMSSDPSYPPQSFLNDNNKMDGFDVEVGLEIAKRMGVRLSIVTPSWDLITAGRWNGRWDISVGSMTPTKQRAQVLDFPAVYYYVPAAFAVHKDSKARRFQDLNGKRIGVCGGCTYENYLNNNLVIDAENVPDFDYEVQTSKVRAYDTDTSAFDDLRIGDGRRLDAVLSAMPTLISAIDSGYPFRIIGGPAFYEPLSVATDKGDPEFDEIISDIVRDMQEDGTLTTLSLKWYDGVDYTQVEN